MGGKFPVGKNGADNAWRDPSPSDDRYAVIIPFSGSVDGV